MDSSPNSRNVPAATGQVRLNMLGPLEIWPSPAGLKPKTQALLAYLGATRAAQRRQDLQELFFSQAEDPQRALRWHLHQLRHAFRPTILLPGADRVGLDFSRLAVDSHAFESQSRARTIPELITALELYRGEFLQDVKAEQAPGFDLWLLGERARFLQLREHGLIDLVDRWVDCGDLAAAIPVARQLVNSNPLSEAGHHRLIWLYAETDQREAALRQFEWCRDHLARELEVDPSPALVALRDRVLAGTRDVRTSAGPAAPAAAARLAADIVGRAPELAQLQWAWDTASDGRVVLIGAEAGAGKSRLLREFRRTLPEPVWLEGRCYESTRTLPYHPWAQILSAQVERLSKAELRRVDSFWLGVLAHLAPALAARLSRGAAKRQESNVDPQLVFTAAAKLLLPERGAQPIVIALDDLQWADEASLQLFHDMAQHLQGRSVVMIGTYRSDEIRSINHGVAMLHDLQRGPLTEIALQPLTAASVQGLLAQLWPTLPVDDREALATRLAAQTGGNPLFLTEIIQELAGSRTTPATLPLPPSLQQLIEHRLHQMTAATRQVLEALAVLGQPAGLSLAQQMSARSEDETVAGIDEGLRRGLLRPASEDPVARYDFVHDLLRTATLTQVTDARRRLLHRRAVTALAQTTATGFSPPADLAGRLLAHALAGQDHAQILRWAPAAAEHARHTGALVEAYHALVAAVAARAQIDGGEPGALELQLDLLEVVYRLERRAELLERLSQAAALLHAQTPARLLARYHWLQAGALMLTNQYAAAFTATEQAYAYSLAASDPLWAARSRHKAGEAKNSLGETRHGQMYLEEALDLYRRAQEPRGMSACMSELAWGALDCGDVARALDFLGQALALAETHGDLAGRAQASTVLALTWNFVYRADRIRACAEQAQALYTELGQAQGLRRARLYIAASHYVAGDWEDSEKGFAAVLTEAEAAGDGWITGWAAQMLGRLALRAGQVTPAARYLETSYRVRLDHGEAQNTISDRAWLGRLSLAQGNAPEALERTTSAVASLKSIGNQTWTWEKSDIWLSHAEALAANHRTDEAHAALAEGHTVLAGFADQLDPEDRAAFFSYHLNARLVAAWRSRQIAPYPEISPPSAP